MAESHVVSALVAKRSELAGLTAHYRKELTRITEEIKTLDATIKMFDPDYTTGSIKPKRYKRKNDFFKHGEAYRLILDTLRESAKPITTNDITRSIMSSKGIDERHEKAVQACVLTILHRQKKGGIVEAIGKDVKGNCIWSLVD